MVVWQLWIFTRKIAEAQQLHLVAAYWILLASPDGGRSRAVTSHQVKRGTRDTVSTWGRGVHRLSKDRTTIISDRKTILGLKDWKLGSFRQKAGLSFQTRWGEERSSLKATNSWRRKTERVQRPRSFFMINDTFWASLFELSISIECVSLFTRPVLHLKVYT